MAYHPPSGSISSKAACRLCISSRRQFWWYVAPTVINTFLEAYDFTGKMIVLFATSGGSDFGNTAAELNTPFKIEHSDR